MFIIKILRLPPNKSVTQISRIYIHYVLFLVDQAWHATSQDLAPITQVPPHPSLLLTQTTCHPCGCLGECWGLPTLNIGPQPMHLTEHHHAWLEVTLRGLDFPSVDHEINAHDNTLLTWLCWRLHYYISHYQCNQMGGRVGDVLQLSKCTPASFHKIRSANASLLGGDPRHTCAYRLKPQPWILTWFNAAH